MNVVLQSQSLEHINNYKLYSIASYDIPYIEHGNVTIELGTDKESLTIICEEGYQINITSNTVLCQNDRTWSDYFGCFKKGLYKYFVIT